MKLRVKTISACILCGILMGSFAGSQTKPPQPPPGSTVYCTSDQDPCGNLYKVVGFGCSTNIFPSPTGQPYPYCCGYTTYECELTGQVFTIRQVDEIYSMCEELGVTGYECPNVPPTISPGSPPIWAPPAY